MKKPPGFYRWYMIESKYGLTKPAYEQVLRLQHNKCPICKKSLDDGTVKTVDHDHKTGMIRGILHDRCNRALGLFGDDAKVLSRAARYLIKKNVKIQKLLTAKYLQKISAQSEMSA